MLSLLPRHAMFWPSARDACIENSPEYMLSSPQTMATEKNRTSWLRAALAVADTETGAKRIGSVSAVHLPGALFRQAMTPPGRLGSPNKTAKLGGPLWVRPEEFGRIVTAWSTCPIRVTFVHRPDCSL